MAYLTQPKPGFSQACCYSGPGKCPTAAPFAYCSYSTGMSCPIGNGIELEAVGLQFETYRWLPCGVTWD